MAFSATFKSISARNQSFLRRFCTVWGGLEGLFDFFDYVCDYD